MSQQSGKKSYHVAIRLLALMRLIPQGKKIGSKELRLGLEKLGFEVTHRTIQRDLTSLQGFFEGLSNDGNKDAYGWFWRDDAELIDVPAIDFSTAMVFNLVERLSPNIPLLNEKLERYLSAAKNIVKGQDEDYLDRIFVVPRALQLIPAKIDSKIIKCIFDAFDKKCRIHGRYTTRDRNLMEVELSPLGIVSRFETTYLVATAWNFKDVRHYALHRFFADTVKLLPEKHVNEPENFDLENYVNQGGFQYLLSDELLKIVLYVEARTAIHLKDTALSNDQCIIELDEPQGWVKVSATVTDSQQLRWWILGLGSKVRVIGPESLKEEIKRDVQKMDSYYRE